MIRIVHAINSFGLGGAERFVYDLVTHLDSNQFRQDVLCLYRTGELAQLLQTSQVSVQVLGMERHMGWQGWWNVYQVLRGLKADVVHAHLPEACWYGLPAAWAARVPVRIAHLQNCHWQWTMKLRLLDMAASAFATKAVACSASVQRFYHERLRYSDNKLKVIHNSVDLERFQTLPTRQESRHVLGLPQNAPILTCVASLTPQKGHRYLLEAMPKVRAAFPETLLLLVGDGELRETLERVAEGAQLTRAVRFLGRRTDIARLLAASDLFVLPSLWEGLPLALLEAAVVGVPAVASQVDGIPEVIKNGVTGILVSPANSEPLAEAILTLLWHPERRLEMGRQARQYVAEQFSIGKIARDMELLYAELLDAAKRDKT